MLRGAPPKIYEMIFTALETLRDTVYSNSNSPYQTNATNQLRSQIQIARDRRTLLEHDGASCEQAKHLSRAHLYLGSAAVFNPAKVSSSPSRS